MSIEAFGDSIIKHVNGATKWYLKDKLHRVDGPAATFPDGREEWYLNGQLHRVGGPAVVLPYSDTIGVAESWHEHGKLHREDGPALIVGDAEEWWFKGERHRIGGPSETINGNKTWHVYHKVHRLDGPARVWANGEVKWFLFGKEYKQSIVSQFHELVLKEFPTESDLSTIPLSILYEIFVSTRRVPK